MNDHPKPLSDPVELHEYRTHCPKNLKPDGECDHCHASDFYYKIFTRKKWRIFKERYAGGQWYCRASPKLEEFEPDYRKEKP